MLEPFLYRSGNFPVRIDEFGWYPLYAADEDTIA